MGRSGDGMNKPIVVVGSINMDLMLRCPHLPRPGETVAGRDFRTVPGGKGANQAVAAVRLGAQVELIGCVGNDPFGAEASAALRAEGVGLAHLCIVPQYATGIAMVLVDDAGENSIALAPGANHALSVAQIDAAAPQIAAAGLLVCQLETPLAAVQRAIVAAHAAGVPVLLNPAPAQPLPGELLRQVELLVLNEGEAALLAGSAVNDTSQAADAAALLRRRGARTVLVTLGADGVVLADAQGCLHLPAHPARALDSTGAGDTFVGALAVACIEGCELRAAVDFAQSAAAFSVERVGAQASMPRAADLRSSA
jgi:ribokinase